MAKHAKTHTFLSPAKTTVFDTAEDAKAAIGATAAKFSFVRDAVIEQSLDFAAAANGGYAGCFRSIEIWC